MSSLARTLALADDSMFDQHRSPEGHPERPERLGAARRGLHSLLSAPGVQRVAVRRASEDELVRVHTPRYIEAVERLEGHSGYLDADTFYSPRSVEAALGASGAAVDLVAAALEGRVQAGFGLLRPPGHHARPDGGMGFCLINHVAVAAASALARGVERVLIVDFDVHHGNGTQDIFDDDPRVLFVSMHQSPQYPGTGAAQERGQADGLGFTVNIPLSAGADAAVYRAAFDRLVLPIAEQFSPGLTLVSAGYDAHARDPLGGMELDDAAYGWMTQQLVRLLGKHPIIYLLEGGYDLRALEGSVRASVEALMVSPVHEPAPVAGRSLLSPRHEAELARAIEAQREFWKF